jgi:hypothetical protein
MQASYLNKGINEPLKSSPPQPKSTKKIKFAIENVVKITNFQFPEWNKEDGKYKSKHRIRITYMDTSGTTRDKSVFFGQVGRADYVDHKSEALRDVFVKRTGVPKSQFDPKFWDINLLNGEESDIIKAFNFLRKTIIA